MLEKYYFTSPTNTDLNMYRCGFEDCKPGHSWGPGIRDHYSLHYILDGRGTFHINGKSYNLGKYDGFLICPDTIVNYQADLQEPWSYGWVGFHGLKAEGFLKQAGLTLQNPVFRYDRDTFLKDCLARMMETKDMVRGREIRLLGQLYEFLSQLVEAAEGGSAAFEAHMRKEEYIRKAIEFIQMNYSRRINIAEIARHVGLDRSYLYSVFKEQLKMSLQEFLLKYRMDKACELMRGDSLSIGDIARSVGYEDPLVFSKAFKKIKGASPRDFRKN